MKYRQGTRDVADPPPGLPRARQSIQLKAILTVLLMVTIPTALCGYLGLYVTGRGLDQLLVSDCAMLSLSAAHAVEPLIDAHRPEKLNAAINDLIFDARVKFILVTDEQGKVLGRRIIDAGAWSDYVAAVPEDQRIKPINLNRLIEVGAERPRLLVRTQPLAVWTPGQAAIDSQDGEADPAAKAEGDVLAGYLTLGLRDYHRAQTLAALRVSALGVVCVLVLAFLPVAYWVVRNYVAPLRRLAAASMKLANFQEAEPVEVEGDDELALLGRCFNTMAQKLQGARKDLVMANAGLEQKVEQRNSELRKAYLQLQREMEDKDQFIRAVSHDLNAPLRNIAGMTAMLMLKHKASLSADVLGKLERIGVNVKSELDLLTDLMELSRIKSRQGKRHKVDLNKIIADLKGALGYELEHKRIRLSVEGTLPTVLVERNRIRQVFQNLVDNAIKYMPADAPVRRIDIGYRVSEGRHLFFVRDSGRGVPAEDQNLIFQVFRRGRSVPGVPGRGVGLASVKTIVECYNGSVWVESQLGGGAAFCFTLAPELVLGMVPGDEGQEQDSNDPAGDEVGSAKPGLAD